MKKDLYLLIILLLRLNAFGQTNNNIETFKTVYCDSTIWMCREEPWVLVFEDEFNGLSLNNNDWSVINGVPRDFNFELQKAWHQDENIKVNNGSLKIITKREYKPNMQYIVSYDPLIYNISDFEYTSGEIWSKRKFMFGRYEARVKIPKGWGLWPAFWLYGNGLIGNEVDIFEYINESPSNNIAKKQHMTVHYDFNHDGQVDSKYYIYIHDDMSSDFHIYTLIYLPGYIKWMVDGNTISEHFRYYDYYNFPEIPIECEINSGSVYMEERLFPFPPMNIIFNTAVFSKKSEKPNNTTHLPACMEVDWFRFFVSANNALVQTKDVQQQNLNNEINNAYAGYNVILDSLNIPTGAQITISALNEVELRPGFEAEYGSDVDIFIHQEPQQQMAYANATPNAEEIMINIQQNDLPDISVYPNPTSENVIVSCPKETVGNGVILVYSSDGVLLYKTDIAEPNTKVIMNYPSGIYILAICDNNNRVSSFKIVKK